MAKMTKQELARMVDEYGQLKAQEAEVQAKINTLKQMLIDTELSEIEGILFRVTVSESERSTLDTKALRKDLPDVADKYTRKTAVTTVRCVSR